MPEYKRIYVSPQLHEQLEKNKGHGQTFERVLIDNLNPNLVPDDIK